MKLILLLLLNCWTLIHIIDSRLYRIVLDDELYPYSIDKSVPSHWEYFSQEFFLFEQIDDDVVKVGGYALIVKSFDHTLPLQLDIRTQYLENSVWREGQIRLLVPSICSELLNPTRFWYNITKLWTKCPPKEGDKWLIESQTVNILMQIPPSFSKGPWRAYFMLSQGLLGSHLKVGTMLRFEFVEVA